MKLLVTFLFVLPVIAGTVSCHKYPLTADLSGNPEAQQGQVLFMQYCNKCHPDGESGLGPSVYHQIGPSIRLQVRQGLGVMPAFSEDVISDAELDKIIVYLDALDEAN